MSATTPPIAFPVDAAAIDRHDGLPDTGLLTLTRALTGMQKEALVIDRVKTRAWRLLCDEGPWLNGTDLAPFPLGYFAAGLASCLLADLCDEAIARGEAAATPHLALDIFFTMEGSVLRGTMAAGVQAIHLTVGAGSGDSDADLTALAEAALVQRSAVNRALTAALPGGFRLTVNGEAVEWPDIPAPALVRAADPAALFERLAPPGEVAAAGPLVRKAGDASSPSTPTGGAVGLQSDQKRTIHIAADAQLRTDGLQKIGARCVQPAGSRFEFLSDTSQNRAPDGQVYLSAGIAFCFMTQLGRYAQIRKLPLERYRIVQKTDFRADTPSPVETAVFLDSAAPVDENLQMVRMGERTCYVHTTFREPVRIDVRSGRPPS